MKMSHERDKRIARKIACAKTRHMSNTKWRKLFAALHALPTPGPQIGIKLIGRSSVMSVPTPGPNSEFHDHFGEYAGLSFVPFSHIEFIEISNSSISNEALMDNLSDYGLWPIEKKAEGILIHGYEWG